MLTQVKVVSQAVLVENQQTVIELHTLAEVKVVSLTVVVAEAGQVLLP